MFRIYAFLGPGSPVISNSYIKSMVSDFFRNESELDIYTDVVPLINEERIFMRWPDWYVQMSYDEGARVVEDVEYISSLSDEYKSIFEGRSKRIFALFGDYSDDRYTNYVIHITDMLNSIPDTVVFDVENEDLSFNDD